MSSIFSNASEQRLRAGWRILIFLIVFLGIVFALIQTAVPALLGDLPKSRVLKEYGIVLIACITISATSTVPLARLLLDKRSFRSLGLRIDTQAFKDIGFGFLLSFLMAGAVFLIMWVTGLVTFEGLNWGGPADPAADTEYLRFMSILSLGSIAILLLETVLVGLWEELVFRGYLLQNIAAGLGMKIAIVISCLLYGLLHASNPDATILSSAIIVLFGFLRIYGYLSTGMLWLSVGMHIGWNFFQGPFFGYGASGHQSSHLIEQAPHGPDWLTGGAFGPEGSVLIIPVLGLALLAMRWWSRGRVKVPV